jgi:hypothetical protein
MSSNVGALPWSAVAHRLAVELGEPIRYVDALDWPRDDRATWAAEAPALGKLIVRARRGDRADVKTRWCAEHLPLLGAAPSGCPGRRCGARGA